MNWFDVFVLFLAVLTGVAGFREGLVRGGIKLAGFLLTLLLLSVFAGRITQFALTLDGVSPYVAVPAVFLGILFALSVFFATLAELLHRTVHLTPLGLLDSGLGTVFGFLKGLFVAGILALILSFFPDHGFLRHQYETSRAAPKLLAFIGKTIPAAASAGMKILNYLSPPACPGDEDMREPDDERKIYI